VWGGKKRSSPGYDTDRAARGLKILNVHKHHIERTWASDSITALVILQYLPEGRLRCDVWPASSSGANVNVNVRVEECFDMEEKVSPMPTSSGIKQVPR
jgi:hypothetical protein